MDGHDKARRTTKPLTAEEISEIRRLAAEGMQQKAIAHRIGRSRSCVCLILKGRRHGERHDDADRAP